MSDVGFEGRVAIITGAGGGLGRSHALLLASRGAQIVVNDLGGAVDGTGASAGPAQQVVAEIEALGGAAVADGHSVASPEGADAIVQTALATWKATRRSSISTGEQSVFWISSAATSIRSVIESNSATSSDPLLSKWR